MRKLKNEARPEFTGSYKTSVHLLLLKAVYTTGKLGTDRIILAVYTDNVLPRVAQKVA